jgi:predicted HicB family RNase H-like nuclease
MTMPKQSPPKKTETEEVSVTIKLPKAVHTKLAAIAASEGKPLNALMAQAAREHAAQYERTAKTVTAYTRKKVVK